LQLLAPLARIAREPSSDRRVACASIRQPEPRVEVLRPSPIVLWIADSFLVAQVVLDLALDVRSVLQDPTLIVINFVLLVLP